MALSMTVALPMPETPYRIWDLEQALLERGFHTLYIFSDVIEVRMYLVVEGKTKVGVDMNDTQGIVMSTTVLIHDALKALNVTSKTRVECALVVDMQDNSVMTVTRLYHVP